MMAPKPTSGKRLASAMVVAATISSAVAIFAITNTSHSSQGTAGFPLGASPRPRINELPVGGAPLSANTPPNVVSPLSGGSAEFLSADLPTRASYKPHTGVRYNADRGFLGPVDATVTRKGPGDYTIDFPDLGDIRSTTDVRAYQGQAICYVKQRQRVAVDERVDVQCVRLVLVFPTLTTPTDSRFTVALIQAPRPLTRDRARDQ
jgi:hypothetical protein